MKPDFTWIRTENLNAYSPITQVYGVCFNEKGEILICRENTEGKWQIAGGHPEKGETIEDSLKREFLEEVDIKIMNIKVLGVQKVKYTNNPKKDEGDLFYQVRCICEVDKLLPQTPDPASGNIWERMFVPAKEITKYVKWGTSGDSMFRDAASQYHQISKEK